MIQTFKKLSYLSVAIVLLAKAPAAVAWTTTIDCAGGTVGAKTLQGLSNTFTESFSKTTYSREQVDAGSQQSCKTGISQGSDGWGEIGGTYTFPTKLAKGTKLWTRVSLFVPVGFQLVTNTGYLKFIRIHTRNATITNHGYHDLLIANPSPLSLLWDAITHTDKNASLVYYFEGGGPMNYLIGPSPANNPVPGKWETYELYVGLDSVSKDQGGMGEVKVWKNNQLLFSLTSDKTLTDAGSYADYLYFFTYWNGGAPQTQYLYFSNLVMTSDTPTNRDSNGNPFIGGAVIKRPLPPGNIVVQ